MNEYLIFFKSNQTKNFFFFKKKDTDPWGKKFFANVPLKVDDFFHVAIITPVIHYTM
jgi:hypothetical protein